MGANIENMKSVGFEPPNFIKRINLTKADWAN